MEAVKINVNKQIDGYTFSILPSTRQLIKKWFPNSNPANNIFVAYDTQSNFGIYNGKLENYIYPALFGIENQDDLHNKIDKVLFVDTQTNEILRTISV
jgi:hypothetical protein